MLELANKLHMRDQNELEGVLSDPVENECFFMGRITAPRAPRLDGNATLATLGEAYAQLDDLSRQLEEEKKAHVLTKIELKQAIVMLKEACDRQRRDKAALKRLGEQPFKKGTLGWYINNKVGKENVRCVDAESVVRPLENVYKLRVYHNKQIVDLYLEGTLKLLNCTNMQARNVPLAWSRAKIYRKVSV